MSHQLDLLRDAQQEEYDKALVAAVEFELRGSVAHAGGELKGFSVKYSEADCLLTLRACFPASDQVAHVGAATLAGCFRRAVNDAYRDNLRWKDDKWGNR